VQAQAMIIIHISCGSFQYFYDADVRFCEAVHLSIKMQQSTAEALPSDDRNLIKPLTLAEVSG